MLATELFIEQLLAEVRISPHSLADLTPLREEDSPLGTSSDIPHLEIREPCLRNNPGRKEREGEVCFGYTPSSSLVDLFVPSTPPPLGYASLLRHLETHRSTRSDFSRSILGEIEKVGQKFSKFIFENDDMYRQMLGFTPPVYPIRMMTPRLPFTHLSYPPLFTHNHPLPCHMLYTFSLRSWWTQPSSFKEQSHVRTQVTVHHNHNHTRHMH